MTKIVDLNKFKQAKEKMKMNNTKKYRFVDYIVRKVNKVVDGIKEFAKNFSSISKAKETIKNNWKSVAIKASAAIVTTIIGAAVTSNAGAAILVGASSYTAIKAFYDIDISEESYGVGRFLKDYIFGCAVGLATFLTALYGLFYAAIIVNKASVLMLNAWANASLLFLL